MPTDNKVPATPDNTTSPENKQFVKAPLVPTPPPEPEKKVVSYTPGHVTDAYRGQGGAYKINEDGVRVPDEDNK